MVAWIIIVLAVIAWGLFIHSAISEKNDELSEEEIQMAKDICDHKEWVITKAYGGFTIVNNSNYGLERNDVRDREGKTWHMAEHIQKYCSHTTLNKALKSVIRMGKHSLPIESDRGRVVFGKGVPLPEAQKTLAPPTKDLLQEILSELITEETLNKEFRDEAKIERLEQRLVLLTQDKD